APAQLRGAQKSAPALLVRGSGEAPGEPLEDGPLDAEGTGSEVRPGHAVASTQTAEVEEIESVSSRARSPGSSPPASAKSPRLSSTSPATAWASRGML